MHVCMRRPCRLGLGLQRIILPIRMKEYLIGGFTIAKMVPKQCQKQWIINSVVPQNTVFALFLLVFEFYRETP